jgi:transposase-like protein
MYDEESPEESEDQPLSDTEATVRCPYCGEENEIALDPDSGEAQEYVEDCQVCCRPWTVHVHYDVEGRAEVHVTSQDE